VIDVPPLRLQVREHQVECVGCPHCQHLTAGAWPTEAPEVVQYGPRLKALAVYLRYFQLLPAARTAELLRDLFGAAPSSATLEAALSDAAVRLTPLVERIRAAVGAAAVAGFDETGFYVEDKRRWLHVACTASLTYYAWHDQRGRAGSAAAGVLPHFQGVAVHDAYGSYWAYSCEHALCNAHLLRDLQALSEQPHQAWATALQKVLREMHAAVAAARAAGAAPVAPSVMQRLRRRYRRLVRAGLARNPPAPPPAVPQRGRPAQSAAYNLLRRLRDHEVEVLRFLHDGRVPFDNNQAERDLRMMKVQQKISGCFRSPEGATAFCRIRSYIATLRKQGQNILAALEQTFLGTPIDPDLAAV
jgi:transposase